MSSKEGPAAPVVNFAAMFEKQVNALAEMQKELLASAEQASRDWLARAEQGRNLANECTTKLLSAKTFPEAAGIYQDWIGRCVATMTEDNQKLAAEGQKFMTSSSKLWSGNGVGS